MPSPTQTVVPSATNTLTPTPITHVVQPGESLGQIAARYGMTGSDILRANQITDPNLVLAWTTLLIPYLTPTPTRTPPAIYALSTANAANTPVLTLTPRLETLNGVPLSEIIVLPPAARRFARSIYEYGQSLGNNPHAFSRIGDSVIEQPYFLTRFDDDEYNLGNYAFLQATIDHFDGSFDRPDIAVWRGLHSWSVFDPVWALKPPCASGETVIACVIRVEQPSILFLRLGTNDVGVPDAFETNMRRMIVYAVEHGVIPVLITKADRHGGDDNNAIIRRLASELAVPLWDFDRAASALPNRGLDQDGIHLTTFYAHDYRQSVALQRGHGLQNLTALLMLDALRNEMQLVDAENGVSP